MNADTVPGRETRQTARLVLLVFAAATVLNLVWLGGAPLADSTEARHAEVGFEFAESGRWLVPTLNYRPHLTKPPLTDWLVAAGIRAFGANEFGARFSNAIVAALGLALAAGFACRLGGRVAGLAAAALYFTSPLYLALSRTISIDMLLAALVTAACWAAWEASREDCRRPWTAAAVFWLALGLGALAKGHLVLLLAALPVIAWILIGKRWRLARRLAWPPTWLIFPAIALPWYLCIHRAFPEWLGWMTGVEFGKRLVGARAGEHAYGAAILFLLFAALPAVPLAFLGFRRRREEDGKGRGARGLLLASVLIPLAVFSLANFQRPNYIAPLVPALAVAAGLGWSRLASGWSGATRRQRLAACLTSASLLLPGPACMAAFLFRPEVDGLTLTLVACAAAAATLCATACLLALLRDNPRAATRCFLAAGLAFWALSVPMHGAAKSWLTSRETCRWIELNLPPGEKVLSYKGYVASSGFYLAKPLRPMRHVKRPPAWTVTWKGTRTPAEITTYTELFRIAEQEGGVWLIYDRRRIKNITYHYDQLRKQRAHHGVPLKLALSTARLEHAVGLAHLYPWKPAD